VDRDTAGGNRDDARGPLAVLLVTSSRRAARALPPSV
jgi:hypothetical protein